MFYEVESCLRSSLIRLLSRGAESQGNGEGPKPPAVLDAGKEVLMTLIQPDQPLATTSLGAFTPLQLADYPNNLRPGP